MPAAYFLGNRLLGSTILWHQWSDTELAQFSEALFCQKCGEIWGRVVEGLAPEWHVTNRRCAKHGDGSFIAPWRTTFEELPPEVLRYELQLRLNLFESTNHE